MGMGVDEAHGNGERRKSEVKSRKSEEI
jgi:hypothetical protein